MDVGRRGLTVIATSAVASGAVEELRRVAATVEVIELSIPDGDALTDHSSEINRAIDAASNDWILIIRGHESISKPLAEEIAGAMGDSPSAWAFRIRSDVIYRGRELRVTAKDKGSVRLLHRRHCRLKPGAPEGVKVQGTVVRMRSPVRAVTFSSAEDHRRALAERFVPHSGPRRLLRFVGLLLATGIGRAGWNGMRYLWIEAGYDHSSPSSGVR